MTQAPSPAGDSYQLFLHGMAEADAGRYGPALRAVRQAVMAQAEPPAQQLAQYARLLVLTRREAEARAVAEQASALAPSEPLTLDTLGNVYVRLGAHQQAVSLFEQAVAAAPRNTQMRYNLASSLGFLGRFDLAAEHYERVIAQEPLFVRAHSALSMLRRQTAEANHVARLQALLRHLGDSPQTLHLHYALAKEYEDLDDPAAVFQHLEAANRAHKARLGYTLDFDRSLFEGLMAGFAKPGYFGGEGLPGEAPIFIFGLPRTGTTLVERILSSHPQVTAAGELQAMPVSVKRLSATPSRHALDGETLLAAAGLAPEAVARAYLAAAAPFREAAGRFSDKLPLNFLYAGFIAKAFPDAHLVCLRRHPLDSIWSNYRHLFATGFSYYNYAYDLADCADYYALFDRLIGFWQQRFPERILEVQYESLVDQQEDQTRRLLAHCALSWDPACLSFHDNPAAVATPSATQVRQPIYRQAIGRWRRYEPWLEPARERLSAAGIAF